METMEKVEWDIYPFSYLGFNYQSRIRCDSYEGSMARKMPINNFIVMNKGILRGTVGVRKNSTLDFISKELARVNHGGTVCFIELAGSE